MDYGPFGRAADQPRQADLIYDALRDLREKPDLLSELLDGPGDAVRAYPNS